MIYWGTSCSKKGHLWAVSYLHIFYLHNFPSNFVREQLGPMSTNKLQHSYLEWILMARIVFVLAAVINYLQNRWFNFIVYSNPMTSPHLALCRVSPPNTHVFFSWVIFRLERHASRFSEWPSWALFNLKDAYRRSVLMSSKKRGLLEKEWGFYT